MSQNNQNTPQDQEIDLAVISKKISGFFDSIVTRIFMCIRFFVRNAIVIALLFVIGAVLGYFLDVATTSYRNQIIVSPNFGSYDYLYNKVDLLQSKINQNDTVFLKSIGIKDPNNLKNIKIEPIIDLYAFVNDKSNTANNAQNSQNFEMVKLLAEDGDINKVAKDKITSKNYYNHALEIKTDGFASNKDLIEPILVYLNKSDFFNKYQATFVSNINKKINDNNIIIGQIDALLNEFSASNSKQKSSSLVFYNENTQLNDILKTKSDLISESNYLRLELISNNAVIKEKSRVLNLKDNNGVNNKLKLIFPFLFVLFYILIIFFKDFYRSQSAKLNAKT
jgi:hypothetical protein